MSRRPWSVCSLMCQVQASSGPNEPRTDSTSCSPTPDPCYWRWLIKNTHRNSISLQRSSVCHVISIIFFYFCEFSLRLSDTLPSELQFSTQWTQLSPCLFVPPFSCVSLTSLSFSFYNKMFLPSLQTVSRSGVNGVPEVLLFKRLQPKNELISINDTLAMDTSLFR